MQFKTKLNILKLNNYKYLKRYKYSTLYTISHFRNEQISIALAQLDSNILWQTYNKASLIKDLQIFNGSKHNSKNIPADTMIYWGNIQQRKLNKKSLKSSQKV